MSAIHFQPLPASRAFLLNLDGLLDAHVAEDMATSRCGRLLHLIPTYWAGKKWFLGDLLGRLFASLYGI